MNSRDNKQRFIRKKKNQQIIWEKNLPCEWIQAIEPKCKESLCPLVFFQDAKWKTRIIIYTIDYLVVKCLKSGTAYTCI
jgi:hypothetical protein